MSKKCKFNLIGVRVKRARLVLGFNQTAFAARLLAAWATGVERYVGALKFNNTLVSHIEGAPLGARHSVQSLATVRLLADVLGLGVQEIAVAQGPEFGPCIAEQPISSPESSAGPLGPEAGLLGLDLPYTSPAEAARFLSGEPQPTPVLIRYIYPPRPISDYMHNKSRVFEVNDTSMEPIMHLGERLVADPVPECLWELLNNQPVVVGYAGQFAIRMVKENDLLERNVLMLYPARESLAPLTVRRELITCIFKVRESFERKIYS